MDDEAVSSQGSTKYKTRFSVSLADYDGGLTRAANEDFGNGDCIYVLFQQGITGTAVYNASSKQWTLNTSQALADTEGSKCQLAFFVNHNGTTSSTVTLGRESCIYQDVTANYELSEGLLTIQGCLTPAMARLRFKGTNGQTGVVRGMSFGTTFDLKKHSTEMQASQLAVSCGTDGFTPYYYAASADPASCKLTFVVNNKTGLQRSFNQKMLQAGSSGYITIPTLDAHQGWDLVDLESGKEITRPVLAVVTVKDLTAHKATLSSAVTDNGHGRLSDVGFVWSKNVNPTMADNKVPCSIANSSFSYQLIDLEEMTTYHVRAYAINEAGTAYSEDATFTTPEGISLATLAATTISDISSTDVTASSAVTNNGKGTISDAGFCYGTSSAPTINDQKVSCGAQNGSFSSKLTGLDPNTTYYVRAYATNEEGTAYGAETTFITRPDMVVRGLQAYYTFDDGTADNVYKDVYHGYALGGSYISDTPNGSGKALKLDSEEYVNIGSNVVGESTNWTISMWVKDFGSGPLFVTNYSTSEIGRPSFGISYEGKFGYKTNLYLTSSSGPGMMELISLTNYMSGMWTLLTLTYNNIDCTLYINGRKVDSYSHAKGRISGYGSSMVIGGKSTSYTKNHQQYQYMISWPDPMKVDNVRIYNVAITEAEVKQIYDYEK